MTPDEKFRLALVDSLLTMALPLADIAEQLAKLGWDYEGIGVRLTPDHFSNVLARYLRGEMSEVDVETWANLIEGRDDVEFDQSFEALVRDVLHELANPILTHPLDPARARHLVDILKSTS
jgi:hypothetical protein